MLRLEKFWEDEHQQPLLRLDRGYIKEQGVDKIIEQMNSWRSIIGIQDDKIEQLDYSNQVPERIFIVDAERTFQNEESKAKFSKILSLLKNRFGDYQQSLSYVASFLLLGMGEQEAMATLIKINDMLPGFWKAEAVSLGIEGFTFYKLLEDFHPEVKKHLEKNLIDPATYCQRWFSGLCVHCLPFKQLFAFYDGFFKGGREFLLRFGLSLMGVLGEQIKSSNDYTKIYSNLVLDYKVITLTEKDYENIISSIDKYDLSKYDLEALRKEAYESKIKSRIESGHKQQENVVVIDDCQWCLDNLPELYCIGCAQVICQDCLDAGKGAEHRHKDFHDIITLEEFEDRIDEFRKVSPRHEVEAVVEDEADVTSKLSEMKI